MMGQLLLFCLIVVLYIKFLDGLEVAPMTKSELVKKLKSLRAKSITTHLHSTASQGQAPVSPRENENNSISTELVSSFLNGRKQIRTKEDSQFRTTQQLILAQGLPFQAHTVTTKDGYILELHRIPPTKNVGHKGAIVFQHGFEDSSETFVLNNRTNTMPFILHDLGYDVWLTNFRGNRYSNSHRSLKNDSEQFWDFSIDEMITYDLPAMLNYVAQTSNPSNPTIRAYFGHSQGGAMGLGGFTEERFRNKELPKIELFVALAPAAYLGSSQCIFIKAFRHFTAGELFFVFGKKAFLPDSNLLHYLIPQFCKTVPFVCKNMYALIAGSDFSDVPAEHLPFMLAHVPSGTSTKAANQLLQWAKTGRFQRYDFGNGKENLRAYGAENPPLYEPKKLGVPTMVFYGDKDELVSKTGVESMLLPNMPKDKLLLAKEIPEYSHVGFLWAPSAVEKVLKHTGLH